MQRTFKIYRYDPDRDAKPRMQTVTIELDGSERMLLDALVKLKEQDPTLSFRRSCREGVCGSDAMNINGKNGLACLTNLRTLKDPIVLKPLPGIPVVRDLIVDMTMFFKQYESVKPYLINHEQPPARERLQLPAQREELNGLYECILCASCSTACPSFWWNPDKFVGPAGLLQAQLQGAAMGGGGAQQLVARAPGIAVVLAEPLHPGPGATGLVQHQGGAGVVQQADQALWPAAAQALLQRLERRQVALPALHADLARYRAGVDPLDESRVGDGGADQGQGR